MSDVWHLPERTDAQNKMIKYASANALRIITNEITIFNTNTEIHQITRRALPDQMIQYKHALMMYKLLRNCIPDNEFMHPSQSQPETTTPQFFENPKLQCGPQYTAE